MYEYVFYNNCGHAMSIAANNQKEAFEQLRDMGLEDYYLVERVKC